MNCCSHFDIKLQTNYRLMKLKNIQIKQELYLRTEFQPKTNDIYCCNHTITLARYKNFIKTQQIPYKIKQMSHFTQSETGRPRFKETVSFCFSKITSLPE